MNDCKEEPVSEELISNEERLHKTLAVMRTAIAQKGAPDFKRFWEARASCMELFKTQISPSVRVQLWEQYTDLTREGRRLKEIVDAESSFAADQIQIAITALETEITTYDEKKLPTALSGPILQALEDNWTRYESLQKRLNALNVFATRINELRKELIQTEMRIRQKNLFFQKLSSLGDLVFPKRKDLILEISQLFLSDIKAFVDSYFTETSFSLEKMRSACLLFKEEIKNLQVMAKILTLNTHAFSKTRKDLSFCWDKLKGLEKLRKKEMAEKRAQSVGVYQELLQRIALCETQITSEKISIQEAFEEVEAIAASFRNLSLVKSDHVLLKNALQKLKGVLSEAQDQLSLVERQKKERIEAAQREKVLQFRERLDTLKSSDSEMSDLALCEQQLLSLSCSKMERSLFDRQIKELKDQIIEKEERNLLSKGDLSRLEDLEELLSQREQRRKESKDLLEEYRKLLGGSSLGFEKALHYNELLTAEKKRLLGIERSIEEVEAKIDAFK